jgi:hypothetical protein
VDLEFGDIRCPESPPVLPPSQWKFGLLLSRNVHKPREFNAPRFIRCGRTRRDLSTLGLTSHKTPKNLCEDEDAEGRSEAAQMFEEGVNEAEHDQMRRAAEAEEQSDELES